MFTGVCLSTRGGLVPGVPGPGGGGLVRGEGGLVWEGAVPGGNPPKRLLLRAVRILLECILVYI